MILKNLSSKLYYGAFCAVLSLLAAAASFSGFYNKYYFREAGLPSGSLQRASLDAMLEGRAERPFVYRQLLPMLVNSIDRLVPEQTKERLFAARGRGDELIRESLFTSPLAQNRAYFLRYWIVYAADLLFAWVAVLAMFLVCRSVDFAPQTAAFAAIITILLIPCFMIGGGYLYDYPELAFFAIAVWMALKFDWWWMIPVVALGAWNKESFLFFIPALYPLLRQRASRINALAGTGVLVLICGVIYCALRARFQLNPGVTAANSLMLHVSFMLHPLNMPHFNRTYGTMMLPLFNPLPVALFLWTLWRGWRFLPRAIQRHAQIAAIINFPLYLLFGFPGELRGLSMLYVPLLLLLAANLARWDNGHARASTQPH